MNFREIYTNANDKIKIDYLYELLRNNPALRTEFLKIVQTSNTQNKASVSYEMFVKHLEDSRKEFVDSMESLILYDLDWEFYEPPHGGYIPEWEAYDSMAEDIVNDTFGGMEDEVIDYLLQGRLSLLLADLLSFHLAALETDIPNPDSVLDDDISEYLIRFKLEEWLNLTINKLPDARIDDGEIIAVLKYFFRYIEDNDRARLIKTYEPVLLEMLNKVSDKKALPLVEELTSIEQRYFPIIANRLVKLTDRKNWEKVAQNIMFEDEVIGHDLLKKYEKKGEKQKYLETAEKLFKNNPGYWSKYLVESIKPDDNKRLFIDVNRRYCIDNDNVEYYRKIRPYLSENEKEQLLNEISRKNSLSAEILKEEGEYERIKSIIEPLAGQWGFEERLLNTIKDYDPAFAFNMIEKHIETLLQHERNRHTYQKVAQWLVYATQLKGQNDRAIKLTMRWFTRRPALPAMRNEFKKAGLV